MEPKPPSQSCSQALPARRSAFPPSLIQPIESQLTSLLSGRIPLHFPGEFLFPSTILAPEVSFPSLPGPCSPSSPPKSLRGRAAVTQGCHVLPFVRLRYSSLYLEGRNPAAGEERAAKSLSIQLGKHELKSPDHVKRFCSQARGSFAECSRPPERACAEGLLPLAPMKDLEPKFGER